MKAESALVLLSISRNHSSIKKENPMAKSQSTAELRAVDKPAARDGTELQPAFDYDSTSATPTVRDNAWLAERVRLLRENHFADVPQGYPIVTRFASRAKYRLGCICARSGAAHITVNQLYADEAVPIYVIDGTLAHELAHYAHGFGSGLPQVHKHAHRGGVVDKELEKRGLGEVNARAEEWRKANWDMLYTARCGDIVERKTAQMSDTDRLWEEFLSRTDCRTLAELQIRLQKIAAKMGLEAQASELLSVDWLYATVRQQGTSYWFAKNRRVGLHGLLADRRVPQASVDFELAYWLARTSVGANWTHIQRRLKVSGLESIVTEALQWRAKKWTSFCNRNHPLK